MPAAELAHAARSRALLPLPGPLDLTAPSTATAVSVIVPTRNERDNVGPLADQLCAAFQDHSWELLFVDDSTDDTPERIRALAARHPAVRLHHRPLPARSTGLGGAVAAGFAVARGDVLVVMDGDLQHPAELVPVLAQLVASGAADIAVGSRYVPGGGTTGLAGPLRVAVSQGSRIVARLLVPRARGVRDPLGGFFAVRADVLAAVPLQPFGYKILLEVLARTPWSTVVEVPYQFGHRTAGTSKAGLREGLRFGRHLAMLARVGR